MFILNKSLTTWFGCDTMYPTMKDRTSPENIGEQQKGGLYENITRNR